MCRNGHCFLRQRIIVTCASEFRPEHDLYFHYHQIQFAQVLCANVCAPVRGGSDNPLLKFRSIIDGKSKSFSACVSTYSYGAPKIGKRCCAFFFQISNILELAVRSCLEKYLHRVIYQDLHFATSWRRVIIATRPEAMLTVSGFFCWLLGPARSIQTAFILAPVDLCPLELR